MSGGCYEYFYIKLQDFENEMQDREMNDLVVDLAEVFHDLEWWQSGDSSEEVYREQVKQFKDKWLHQSAESRIANYIDEELEETRKRLYNMLSIPIDLGEEK